MKIYLIEHPQGATSGFFGGVDFHLGRGTTSSEYDARRLANLGYRVSELVPEQLNTGSREGSPGPSLDFSPTKEEQEAAAVREAARKKQDEIERNPDSDWSKERKEKAIARAGGRRKR